MLCTESIYADCNILVIQCIVTLCLQLMLFSFLNHSKIQHIILIAQAVEASRRSNHQINEPPSSLNGFGESTLFFQKIIILIILLEFKIQCVQGRVR